MNRNHWITFVGHTVVGWEILLPPPTVLSAVDVEPTIRFGGLIIDAGKRYAVWDTQAYANATAYVDYARVAARERGRLPLIFQGPQGAATPARLAFYRGGSLVEESVSDVGELRRTTCPEALPSTARSTPPIVVAGTLATIGQDKEIRITIRLDTDIWFPRVMGFEEPIEGEATPDDYDNRALAERHTPRLNAFLTEIANATCKLGGRWSLLEVDGIAVNYRDQWDENGIHL